MQVVHIIWLDLETIRCLGSSSGSPDASWRSITACPAHALIPPNLPVHTAAAVVLRLGHELQLGLGFGPFFGGFMSMGSWGVPKQARMSLDFFKKERGHHQGPQQFGKFLARCLWGIILEGFLRTICHQGKGN